MKLIGKLNMRIYDRIEINFKNHKEFILKQMQTNSRNPESEKYVPLNIMFVHMRDLAVLNTSILSAKKSIAHEKQQKIR